MRAGVAQGPPVPLLVTGANVGKVGSLRACCPTKVQPKVVAGSTQVVLLYELFLLEVYAVYLDP